MTFEAGPTMGASGVTREAYEAMERANALLRARLSMVEMANIIAQARIQAALDICAARLTADTDPVRFAALVRDALTVPLPINPEKVDNAARAALVEPVGEPPREVFGVPRNAAADDALTERLDAIKDAERGVGDPQPPTCATCRGTGQVKNPRAAQHLRLEPLMVPCPSCAPTEPGDAP